MNLLTLIIAVGVGVALLVIAAMAAYDRRRRKAGPLDGPALPGQQTIAQIGMDAEPEMSLNTVVMRPTIGLRVLSIGFSVAAIWFIWGVIANSPAHEPMLAVGVTALILYTAAYVAMYEARYNDEQLTAPDWFMIERHYDWRDFDSIGADGKLLLEARFAGKRMHLQRYLVGMPTFLTFLEDVAAVNRKT